jgi:DNA polymerase-3 subunit gamma/tau
MNLTSEGEACNECESCKAFNEQRSYNIHELDAASNNSVDDIRSLIEQVRIPPQIGKYKVYIIDEVHMLSPAAFNAFLKTLEEPPHHALFILATTEKHKMKLSPLNVFQNLSASLTLCSHKKQTRG